MDFMSNTLSAFCMTIFIIGGPPFLSCIIIIQWMKSITETDSKIKSMHGKKEFFRYTFTLHTNKGLSSQGLFWLSILTPFIYFILLGLIAWKGYTLRLNAEGFKTFISISALPLGVLSLALPLSVSVARFHTSKQTAKQIEIVSQKNNIDLYNSHRKELFGYFQQLGEVKYLGNFTVKNKVHPRVYKAFFQGNPSEGIPQLRVKSFLTIERLLYVVREELINIIEAIDFNVAMSSYVVNYGGDICELAHLLGIPEINELMEGSPKVPCKIQGQDLHLETVGRTTDEAISAFRCAENFFHNLCDFANYESKYFNDTKPRKKFDEVIRLNGKKPDKEKVIECLHAAQIKQAIEDEQYKKSYPNTPRA